MLKNLIQNSIKNQFFFKYSIFIHYMEAKEFPQSKISLPMADSYDHKLVEEGWYDWWVKKEFFKADPQKLISKEKKPFTILIPPPNVTGALHLGHALFITIQDAMIRFKKMSGFETLWIPGTDHAGISTQTVVERQLMTEEKKTRHDLGREEFIKKVFLWKEKYGNHILKQLSVMGGALDWSRLFFTMDEPRSKAVIEAFIKMAEDKTIFRANRIVNWCCHLRSCISDIEVDTEVINTPRKFKIPGFQYPVEIGILDHFIYKIKNSNEEIEVATTRLETMLGDTAVAVHPDDKRYEHLIGKEIEHPFIKDRKMKVIADNILVDMTFGSGAVKVTPANDQNDFESGKRNNLENI